MAYTPHPFTKTVWDEIAKQWVTLTETPQTPAEEVQLVFDGWTSSAPSLPREPFTDMQEAALDERIIELVKEQSGVSLLNPTGLDGWRAAVAARGASRANILLLGDSIFEGVGATSWTTRLSERLQSVLRALLPISTTQGTGYRPANNYSGLGSTPGLTANVVPLTSTDYGLGRKALGVTLGKTLTYTFTGTRVRVWYGWNNDFSTGGATLSLDGGAGVALPIAPDTTPGSGQYWDSGAITDASHTVTITGTSAFPFWVEGYEVFGSAADVTSGIHVYDSAHGGWASNAFAPDSAGGLRLWQAADAVKPNLTIVNLGTNDTAWDFTTALTKGALRRIIDRANIAAGSSPHSVLIVMPYRSLRSDLEHTSRLDGYRTMMRDLAGGNVSVLDLEDFWPELAVGQGYESGVMYEDEYPVHPNQAGHDMMVSILTEALMRPAASVSVANEFTAKGELLVGVGSATKATLPAGANGKVLKANTLAGTGLEWGNLAAADVTSTPTGDIQATTVQAALAELDTEKVPYALYDAKGDLLVGTADNTAARLAAGANGRFLVADSTQATGLRWDAHDGTGDPHTQYVLKNSAYLGTESLNANLTPGFYIVANTGDWATRGLPAATAGHLHVMRSGTNILHRYTQVSSGGVLSWFRTSNDTGATWGSWVQEGKSAVDAHVALADPHTQYALEGAQSVAIATPLNALTTPGDYRSSYNADFASVNQPALDGGHVTVTRNGNYIWQRFIQNTMSGAGFFTRSSTDGGTTWGAWVQEGKGAVDTHNSLVDPHNQYLRKAVGGTVQASIITETTGTMRSDRRTDAPVDAKRWDWWAASDGTMHLIAKSDAGVDLQTPLTISRDGRVALNGIPNIKGSGSPEGVQAAPVGSRYVDAAATNGAVEWVKASGSGNTGWRVSSGDTGWRNVTSLVLNGWTATVVLLRRTTHDVHISCAGLNGAGAGADQIVALPNGFQSSSAANWRIMGIDGSTAKLLQAVTGNLTFGGVGTRATMAAFQASVSFPVHSDPAHVWPTGALPGTAT